MQSLPGRLPAANVWKPVIRPGASSRRNPFLNFAPSLSQSAEPRQQRRVSAFFFVSSVFGSVSKSRSSFYSMNSFSCSRCGFTSRSSFSSSVFGFSSSCIFI
jgi:hypothetical protein